MPMVSVCSELDSAINNRMDAITALREALRRPAQSAKFIQIAIEKTRAANREAEQIRAYYLAGQKSKKPRCH